MNKIGDLEKDLDETTEPSFSPCDYKPTMIRPVNESRGSANSGPTRSYRLPHPALFLPCHYFTYAAGTSTGG